MRWEVAKAPWSKSYTLCLTKIIEIIKKLMTPNRYPMKIIFKEEIIVLHFLDNQIIVLTCYINVGVPMFSSLLDSLRQMLGDGLVVYVHLSLTGL